MEAKKTLGFVVAILAVLLAVNFVAAGDLSVRIDEVSVNDVSGNSSVLSLAGYPGETVPVVVRFTALDNLDDLKLKVWIDGYKSDISASTERFDVVNGTTYVKRIALTLPDVEDLDNLDEELTLHVRIADSNDEVEESYSITMQRESYALEVLSVEAPSKASAGEIIGLDVVVQNIGTKKAKNVYVTAAIPELGVSRRVYFSDLYAEDDSGDNEDDARERRIYLAIPSDAKTGNYELQVKASTYDATTAPVKKVISVTGLSVANVTETTTLETKKEGIPTSIVVLTIVLAIIFVVLLVVLIVLLTKKPAEKIEDFGETSYY